MSTSLFTKLDRRFRLRRISGDERRQIAHEKRVQFKRSLPNQLRDFPWTIHRWPARHLKRGVLVVGGGFAGLTAAWSLARCGVKVTVLEAQEHVGGRVRSLTDFTPGRIIEAGAELIGLNHPVWLMFTQFFGLGLSVVTPEDDYRAARLEMPLRLKGELISRKTAEKIYDEMEHAFATLKRSFNQIKDPDEPWKAPLAKRWDNRSVADWIDGKHFSPLAKAALETELSNTNAVPTSAQSFLGLLALMKGGAMPDEPLGFWTLSEVFRCAAGNQGLARCLEADLVKQQPGCVKTKQIVHRIKIYQDGTGCVCRTARRRFESDCVILAVPPTVWDSIHFEPKLPAGMQMQTGAAIKYLSNVDRRLWIKQGKAASGVSDSLGMTWEGTDNQIGGNGVELTVFAGGTCAAKPLQSTKPKVHFRRELGKLYDGFAAEVTRDEFIEWPKRAHIRTGYSCPAPGQVCTVGKFLNGSFAKRLFFAGEHTSMAFSGYMEGALQSGIRAAVGALTAKW